MMTKPCPTASSPITDAVSMAALRFAWVKKYGDRIVPATSTSRSAGSGPALRSALRAPSDRARRSGQAGGAATVSPLVDEVDSFGSVP